VATPKQLCASGACKGKHFSMVSAAADDSVAIATDGSLWGWATGAAPAVLDGSNGSGTKDWAGLTWIDVQSHLQDSGAIDSSGNQWGWGYDVYGQIGDGVVNSANAIPLPVALDAKVLSNAVNVVACPVTMGALDAQGIYWGWGGNVDGETGLTGSQIVWPTNVFTGKQPHTMTTQPTQWAGYSVSALAIACGGNDSFVADEDGWVWAMGLDDNDQLGFPATGSNVFGTQDTPYYPDGYEPNGGSASVDDADAGCPNTGCVWSTGGNQASGQWY
jgi:alpha-tubulin suppressor-like RCC1 family protein